MSDVNKDQEAASSKSNGVPSVAGRPKAARGLKLVLICVALLLLVAVIAWATHMKGWWGTTSIEEAAEKNSDANTAGLTATNSLTRVDIKDVHPDPEPEPKPEPAETAQQATAKKELPMPLPMPAPETANIGPDGKPIPTLEELKFAAPMMGTIESAEAAVRPAGGYPGAASAVPPVPAVPGAGALPAPATPSLSSMMDSVSTPSKTARLIKNQSLTLSKGTVIECILETRVDTTVPGMTTCVVPRNIYSMDGRTLLIEKGTKAIGEYQGAVQNGLARIFMLWTELRTPKGVSIAINSPTTDNLGGAGMGGAVDFHWWERFGNALLFSMVSDGFQYVVNTANRNSNNGDVTYNNTTDGIDEIIKEAMAQSGNIPPTLIKNQGERVAIFVARDLNFSNVYNLSLSDK